MLETQIAEALVEKSVLTINHVVNLPNKAIILVTDLD